MSKYYRVKWDAKRESWIVKRDGGKKASGVFKHNFAPYNSSTAVHHAKRCALRWGMGVIVYRANGEVDYTIEPHQV